MTSSNFLAASIAVAITGIAPMAHAGTLIIDANKSCMQWSLLNQNTNQYQTCADTYVDADNATNFQRGSCTIKIGDEDAHYNLRYGGHAGYNLSVTDGVVAYRGQPPAVDALQPSENTLTFNTALVRFRVPKSVRDDNGTVIGGWTGTWSVEMDDIHCDNGKNPNRDSATHNSRNLFMMRGARFLVPNSATIASGEVRNEAAAFRIAEDDRVKQVFTVLPVGSRSIEVETSFYAGQKGDTRGNMKIILNRAHWIDAILPIPDEAED